MKPSISAIRAITAEFVRQFIQPFVWIALGVIAGLLLLVTVLASTLSQWWWLLAVPIMLLGLTGLILWLVVRMILGRVSPRLDSAQRQATRQFVTKLQFATETIRTPYPMIIFYVIRDIVLQREAGFLREVVEHSQTLKPDFERLRRLF